VPPQRRLDDTFALDDRHVFADQARVDAPHVPLRVHLYDLGPVDDSRAVVDRYATHEQIHEGPDGLAALRDRHVAVDRVHVKVKNSSTSYASMGPPLSPTPESSFLTAAPSRNRTASTWAAFPGLPKTGPSPTAPWPNPLDELAAVDDGRVVPDRGTKSAGNSTFTWRALLRSRMTAPSSSAFCRPMNSNCCTTASAALPPPPIPTSAVLPWATTALSPVTAALVNTTPLQSVVKGVNKQE